MFKKVFLYCALIPYFLTATEVCVAPPTPDNFIAHENIVYKDKLAMDLYLPNEGENFPLAFIVHGGSWIGGDRKDFSSTAKRLTGMGYAAATVSYRLAKKASGRFPAPLEDLRCALRTLRARSAEFSIDPNRVVGMGQSAGAHLVAELALTADRLDINDLACPLRDENIDLQSVIGYFGPYDLRKTEDLNFGQIWILSNFLGALPSKNPVLAEFASPVAQIHNELTSFYLVHAANDNVVPVKSSQEFSVALADAGKDVRYVETTDGAHSIAYFDERPFAQEATCGTLETLNSHLR